MKRLSAQHAFPALLPRLADQAPLGPSQASLQRAHHVLHQRFGCAHFGQGGFVRNAVAQGQASEEIAPLPELESDGTMDRMTPNEERVFPD